MLRTLRAPPPEGSLRESVLLLALMQEEIIEHARFRAAAQLQLDEEGGMKAFEDYMKLAFPYLESSRKAEFASAYRMLEEEVRRGPVGVRALLPSRLTSRVQATRYNARGQRQ